MFNKKNMINKNYKIRFHFKIILLNKYNKKKNYLKQIIKIYNHNYNNYYKHIKISIETILNQIKICKIN